MRRDRTSTGKSRATLSAIGLFLVVVTSGHVHATEYWVDNGNPQADDSNPGTEQEPWLTIQHSADTAMAGDTVRVRQGVYRERVRLTVSGEDGMPISFIAEPIRSVLMHGFTIDGADHLLIQGFDITSSSEITGWDETQGFFVMGGFITIADNYIHDLSSSGVTGYWHEPYPHDVHIKGNTLYRIQMGINISGQRWVVENNEINRLYQYGEGDCDYSRFFGEDHIIRGNFFHGTDFDEVGEAHVDCFQTFTNNGEQTRYILFEGNICFDFHQALMASNAGGTDTHSFTFRNNIFAHGLAWGLCVHDVSNILAQNNTFAHIAYHGAGFRGSSTGNVMLNNIFCDISSSYWGSEGGEVSGDHNLIFQANAPGEPGPNDLLDTDPLFVDPEGDDYHLTVGSPAIDAAADLAEVAVDCDGTTRPQGAGWDMGAFEYDPADPLIIVTISLPSGRPSRPYSAELKARGGTLPYTWSVAGRDLPPGLSLEATGEIAGSPSSAGMFTFTAQVLDAKSDQKSRVLSITIIGPEKSRGCGCRAGQRSGLSFASLFLLLVLLSAGMLRLRPKGPWRLLRSRAR